MSSRLLQKTVLITGASAGIGAATAHEFAAAGSNLILVARRIDLLNALRSDLLAKFRNIDIEVHQLDVSSREEVTKLAENIASRGKHVHVLVNNAGLALSLTKSWEISDAE